MTGIDCDQFAYFLEGQKENLLFTVASCEQAPGEPEQIKGAYRHSVDSTVP